MLEKTNEIIEAKGQGVEPHHFLDYMYWRAPDILEASIEDLMAEEGYN